MHFEYASMWRHFMNRVGELTDDVYAATLTPDFKAIKYDNENRSSHFLHKSMDAYRLSLDDELVAKHDFFKSGAYVVIESPPPPRDNNTKDRQRILKKKNLFVVGPKIHHHSNGQKDTVTADHLTFSLNSNSKFKLQFHKTMYIPNPDHPSREIGRAYRINNHLPDSFDFCGQDEICWVDRSQQQQKRLFLISADLDDQANACMIKDVFTRHIRHPNELRPIPPSSSSNTSSVGGGSRVRSKRKGQSVAFKGDDLSTMFRTLPIAQVVVIAVRSSDIDFDVTAVFLERLQHRNDKSIMEFAFVFKMHEDDLRDASTLQLKIASLMQNKTWNDFV